MANLNAAKPAPAETGNRLQNQPERFCGPLDQQNIPRSNYMQVSGASKATGGRFWPVVSNGKCLGHFLHRGKLGIEVFDAADKSIGTFPTLTEAATALQQGGSQ